LSLLEVSNTSSGSYDIVKLHRLLWTKRVRTVVFGLLVVLAAIAQTSFTNVMAYEAFTSDIRASSTNIRSLNPFILSFGDGPNAYSFSDNDTSAFEEQVTTMLLDLSFQSAMQMLLKGDYLGINANRESLDSLVSTITHLHGVPGYRLSLQCVPALPRAVEIWSRSAYDTDLVLAFDNLGNSTLGIDVNWDSSTLETNIKTGTQAFVMLSDYDSLQNTPIFTTTDTVSYLALSTPLDTVANDCSSSKLSSSYGDLNWSPLNASSTNNQGNFKLSPSSGVDTIGCLAGIQCKVARETGSHALTRNSRSVREISNSTWSGNSAFIHVLLSDWQQSLGNVAPIQTAGSLTVSGFGSFFV